MTDNAAPHELIVRLRQGDVTALTGLYDRHAAVVYGLACRIVQNHADAQDVVQETFLQVWQQALRFDDTRGEFEGWLLMITRSRALDRLRRRSGRWRREEGLEQLGDLMASSEWATDQLLIREEGGRGIRHEFEALPVVQRIAVELAFYEGLTHAEIADVLCQPLGTIKTRIRLGLHKMRDGLTGEPTDPRAHEPSPFTVALAEYLARRPRLTATYRSLRGLRILIVDDDAETVDLTTTVLQSAGAIVLTAPSTADGVACLGIAWPDVILADIAMPLDDGYSLIRQARALADSSGRRLTAAAFTALGDGERQKALRAGFATLVSKPVQPHVLLDVVACLSSRAA